MEKKHNRDLYARQERAPVRHVSDFYTVRAFFDSLNAAEENFRRLYSIRNSMRTLSYFETALKYSNLK